MACFRGSQSAPAQAISDSRTDEGTLVDKFARGTPGTSAFASPSNIRRGNGSRSHKIFQQHIHENIFAKKNNVRINIDSCRMPVKALSQMLGQDALLKPHWPDSNAEPKRVGYAKDSAS